MPVDRIDYSLTRLKLADTPVGATERFELGITNLTKAECEQVTVLLLGLQMSRTYRQQQTERELLAAAKRNEDRP